jgi:hypothetical protein
MIAAWLKANDIYIRHTDIYNYLYYMYIEDRHYTRREPRNFIIFSWSYDCLPLKLRRLADKALKTPQI